MASRQSDPDNRKIQRVQPLLLRLEKKKNDDYVPLVVSLGPYHHGKPELALVEAFKPTMVDMFFSGSPEVFDREYYYGKVLEIVEDIKSCYELESPPKYSDGEIAEMMLCDATVVIFIMQSTALIKSRKYKEAPEDVHKFIYIEKYLGSLVLLNVMRDMWLLENQIPLFLIKLLVRLRYGAGEDDELLSRYFRDFPKESLSRELEEDEPLHLLEATYRLLFTGSSKPEKANTNTCRSRWLPCAGAEKDTDLETGGVDSEGNNHHSSSIFASVGRLLACRKSVVEFDPRDTVTAFRSATDLKAKGIYFKACATSSRSLTDVSFRTHLFYARLQLPQAIINSNTKVGWKNTIAYEVCPSSRAKREYMLSYLSFMKSLIQTTEDVKELREKKILLNMLDSDQEVLDMFNDINADGVAASLFKEVHYQIQAHCSSRSKNWAAELVHANFQSPWKVIAFVAAVSLLAISAAQLYYAVHPN